MLTLALAARGLNVDALIDQIERGLQELRTLRDSPADTIDTGLLPSDWPAEHVHVKVTGESGVHAGQLVTDQAFDCPCGAHVPRGRPYYDHDERFCIDCGISQQECA